MSLPVDPIGDVARITVSDHDGKPQRLLRIRHILAEQRRDRKDQDDRDRPHHRPADAIIGDDTVDEPPFVIDTEAQPDSDVAYTRPVTGPPAALAAPSPLPDTVEPIPEARAAAIGHYHDRDSLDSDRKPEPRAPLPDAADPVPEARALAIRHYHDRDSVDGDDKVAVPHSVSVAT
ncbi:MAG: hypothetical protein P4M00_17840 [Azospirillaceae bacterium]|nr:hypothetical protein [Azospirillaceae bacterium]